MADLFHTLNVGSTAIGVNRKGVDVTAKNIANANTEGYTRRRLEVDQYPSVQRGSQYLGGTLYASEVRKGHDQFLQKELGQALSERGTYSTKHKVLSKIQSEFSRDSMTDIHKAYQGFFKALHQLSRDPVSLASREQVKNMGQVLSETFHQANSRVRNHISSINKDLTSTTIDATKIIEEISKVNTQINISEGQKASSANDLRDRRDQLVTDLSSLINIHYYEGADGMLTVQGPGSTLLVERGHAASLAVLPSSNEVGHAELVVFGFGGKGRHNITSKVQAGKMHALLDVRDKVAHRMLSEQNHMAKSFVDQFNKVHAGGFGLDKNSDEDLGLFKTKTIVNFFNPLEDESDAAAKISLSDNILNSLDLLATRIYKGGEGDNRNILNLIKIKDAKIFNGNETDFNEYFASYQQNLGQDVKNSKDFLESLELVVSDLEARRDSVSGVSLDEEAAQMIRWQSVFSASSKIVSTVDEMLQTILNLKR